MEDTLRMVPMLLPSKSVSTALRAAQHQLRWLPRPISQDSSKANTTRTRKHIQLHESRLRRRNQLVRIPLEDSPPFHLHPLCVALPCQYKHVCQSPGAFFIPIQPFSSLKKKPHTDSTSNPQLRLRRRLLRRQLRARNGPSNQEIRLEAQRSRHLDQDQLGSCPRQQPRQQRRSLPQAHHRRRG